MRKNGMIVTESSSCPMFVYLGDTDSRVFENSPKIFDYPTIIVECTFFKDEQERAEKNGHIHWDKLEHHIISHPNVTFILIHFSLRYSEEEIHQFFDNLSEREENPLNLSNVILFVTDGCEGKN